MGKKWGRRSDKERKNVKKGGRPNAVTEENMALPRPGMGKVSIVSAKAEREGGKSKRKS